MANKHLKGLRARDYMEAEKRNDQLAELQAECEKYKLALQQIAEPVAGNWHVLVDIAGQALSGGQENEDV